MPTTVNEQVADSVAYDNVKTVAGSGAQHLAESAGMRSELASLRVESERQRLKHESFKDALREKLLADVVTSKTTIEDATAKAKLVSGIAESQILADNSQLAAGQVSGKIAQSTPGAEANIVQLTTMLSTALAQLQAIVEMAQAGTKVAQTVPPVTHS